MTPEAQRIAIAEACGWKRYELPGGWCWTHYKLCVVGGPLVFDDSSTEGLPDYLNDLNAMHEAEKVLKTTDGKIGKPCERDQYCMHLNGITGHNVTTHSYLIIHATAAQRAEAFLRTLGKWKD